MRKAIPKRRKRNGTVKSSANVRTAGFLGQELKFFDSSRATLALTAPTDATGGEADPATLNCIFAPTQGTGAQNRDGRRVVMKSVQINGVVRSNIQSAQSALDPGVVIMISLVLDKQSNAAQLNSEDVYTNPGANAELAAFPLRDLERSTRFRVLKTVLIDQLQNMNTGNDAAGTFDIQGKAVPFSFFVKLNEQVEFVANGGTIADIQDNSLHIIAYTTDVTSVPAIAYNARVRFMG